MLSNYKSRFCFKFGTIPYFQSPSADDGQRRRLWTARVASRSAQQGEEPCGVVHHRLHRLAKDRAEDQQVDRLFHREGETGRGQYGEVATARYANEVVPEVRPAHYEF